ncbi:hypothetical protein ARALYDRAFT_352242 [Arabidopsis lyrata subsp. lyrata]|uniref:TRF2/HOY1 PH-like domain-containing protein n=1 Tax=Arabidopsis lyrata subsp. lyrata TaxID=81972 RepID=D7M077_ARALL|nr:hypothetical protein ARALYDRAFT_352242 [Arabidopsis lyrata subsp. lyrata]
MFFQVPLLNLPLTTTPELINKIETYLNRNYTCPHQKIENSKTSTLPKSSEKLKAMNFPISMIKIGTWTPVAINPEDIVAKFYFAKKKLIWEFLFGEEETNMPRLKRKIEIQWNDVSSFEESIYTHDETGILKIELRKRPTFFIETNPQAGKHTQWKQLDRDFTDNQASTCRRHTIHFPPGVLQKNLEKLLTNSFWSKLYNVPFPVEESLFFDIGFKNNNSSHNSHSQTVGFNVNYGLQHHHYSQGIGGVGVGEGNFNISPQFRANDGWQRNQMNQDEIRKMQIIREIVQSQAYAAVADTQTNNVPMYPPVGSFAATLIEEEERQYKDQTNVDGNYHIKEYQKIPYIRSSNWEVLPGMDVEEDW